MEFVVPAICVIGTIVFVLICLKIIAYYLLKEERRRHNVWVERFNEWHRQLNAARTLADRHAIWKKRPRPTEVDNV